MLRLRSDWLATRDLANCGENRQPAGHLHWERTGGLRLSGTNAICVPTLL